MNFILLALMISNLAAMCYWALNGRTALCVVSGVGVLAALIGLSN
jgi:hypothetical protein